MKENKLEDFNDCVLIQNIEGTLAVVASCYRWSEEWKTYDKNLDRLLEKWCNFFAYGSKEERDKHLNQKIDFSGEKGREWVHSYSDRVKGNKETLLNQLIVSGPSLVELK